jgi:hypothetical protein
VPQVDKDKQRFPQYPHVRNAFAMNINRQEFCQVTGLSDMEEIHHIPGIVQGDWSNNWVPSLELGRREIDRENQD